MIITGYKKEKKEKFDIRSDKYIYFMKKGTTRKRKIDTIRNANIFVRQLMFLPGTFIFSVGEQECNGEDADIRAAVGAVCILKRRVLSDARRPRVLQSKP